MSEIEAVNKQQQQQRQSGAGEEEKKQKKTKEMRKKRKGSTSYDLLFPFFELSFDSLLSTDFVVAYHGTNSLPSTHIG